MNATHDHANTPTLSTREYWESFYQERDRVWPDTPNLLLAREMSSCAVGSALDLGCGEGADALWLAERGWRVTATDVSQTALDRAEAAAKRRGLSERIDWQRHDLAESFPSGRFDLVSAHFLHSPIGAEDERTAILRRAAEAVASGGLLLIAGHAEWPSWMTEPPVRIHFPTTAEVLDGLRLDPAEWRVELDELVERDHTGPEGQKGTRKDSILRIRRVRLPESDR